MLQKAILSIFEKAANSYISLDPESDRRCKSLANHVIAINCRGLPLAFHIHLTADKIKFKPVNDNITTDAQLTGTPLGLLRLSLLPAKTGRFFAEDVSITGNIELGQAIKDILDNMDIDWEEHLSHITGDIGAHGIGTCARSVKQLIKDSLLSTKNNMSEYLQEEAYYLPSRLEVSDFFADVDCLRDDVERFSLRFNRAINAGEDNP